MSRPTCCCKSGAANGDCRKLACGRAVPRNRHPRQSGSSALPLPWLAGDSEPYLSRCFVSFVCFCGSSESGGTAAAVQIRVHPRIAAWPPRGFTPCLSVAETLASSLSRRSPALRDAGGCAFAVKSPRCCCTSSVFAPLRRDKCAASDKLVRLFFHRSPAFGPQHVLYRLQQLLG
jgi:hypothetical protein